MFFQKIATRVLLFHWINQGTDWTYGYGSIPISTIFRVMNIHLPAILRFTRGTRFWPIPIWVFVWNRVPQSPVACNHIEKITMHISSQKNHFQTFHNAICMLYLLRSYGDLPVKHDDFGLPWSMTESTRTRSQTTLQSRCERDKTASDRDWRTIYSAVVEQHATYWMYAYA